MGGHRFQIGGSGTTGSPAGDGPAAASMRDLVTNDQELLLKIFFNLSGFSSPSIT